jgi:hypothetical protein
MSSKTLPYGMLVGSASRAPCFATKSRTWIALPEVPLAERPGDALSLSLRIAGDRSAEIELERAVTGNSGHVIKEQLREAPKNQIKRAVTSLATGTVPGMDVAEHDVRGLDSARDPVSFWAKGRHKTFLDDSKGELSCKLPLNVLQLGGRLASGEGTRDQDFFLSQSIVTTSRVRVELADGLKLAQELSAMREEFGGGHYTLALEDVGPTGFTLVRELMLPPMHLPAAEYPKLVAFSQRVDEAERVRLRFTRQP